MSRSGNAPKSQGEEAFRDALFKHLDRKGVKEAYIDPVIAKLLHESKRGRSRGWEGNFKALKRAVSEVAANWKLEHGPMGGVGIGKAAEARAVDQVSHAVMEYFLVKQVK